VDRLVVQVELQVEHNHLAVAVVL
jgi:hypothetical protein